MVMRVAVIGCGAAGLCALRHLSARPSMFEAVGFEQLPGVGGTWRYTDAVGTDNMGLPVQSSMYRNLRTNLPKEVMAFPEFPFPSDLPSFIHHTDVLAYLQQYCRHYDLEHLIKFETKVDLVEPVSDTEAQRWRVTYSTVQRDQSDGVHQQMFDAVMVCNGHYSVPLIPEIEGMEEFQGTVIHSHDYREPAVFTDKRVVCLGAAASGQDVSLDIATMASKVILSHNKPPLQTVLPENVVQRPGISRMTPEGAVFKNGDEEKVNVLMLCTGYRYTFPFLDAKCSVVIEDERVSPLYKHIVHTKYPTLGFIGICKTICPFPQFDCQVQFFLSLLDGRQHVPSKEEMDSDIERDFQVRLAEGLPRRHAHTMGPRQWAYNDSLAEIGQFKTIPPVVRELYNEVHRMRVLDLPQYKEKQYKLLGDSEFQEVTNS